MKPKSGFLLAVITCVILAAISVPALSISNMNPTVGFWIFALALPATGAIISTLMTYSVFQNFGFSKSMLILLLLLPMFFAQGLLIYDCVIVKHNALSISCIYTEAIPKALINPITAVSVISIPTIFVPAYVFGGPIGYVVGLIIFLFRRKNGQKAD